MAIHPLVYIAKRCFDRTETPPDSLLSTSTSSISMSASSISSSTRRPGSRDYDTGFPDSFAAHTTSLRHPDANTSPDASISADDIDSAKALHRHRKSFLQKHRRTISHGVITAEMEHEFPSNALGSIDSAVDMGESKLLVYDSRGRLCTDYNESIDGASKAGEFPGSPTSTQFDQRSDTKRRHHLFSKWRHSK